MANRGTTPWQAVHYPDFSRVSDREGRVLAQVVGNNHARHADLFAASPELYYVCRFVARENPGCTCGLCAPCSARRVVKRVRGR
jgi:hypothetical protein